MDLPVALHWIWACWLFAVGGATGSFLNVVVYRMPKEESLLYPPSRCPACGTRILWHDNVPILSWLWLRGRCRNCDGRISVRYPIVEAAVALLFVGLAEVELFSGGANLPVVIDVDAAAGSLGGISVRLWAVYACHLVLLCTLFAAALIALGGNRVPARLFLPVLVVGLIGPAVWPWLRPLPESTVSGWSDVLIAAAVGMLLAGVRQLRFNKTRAIDPLRDLMAAAAAGLLLGTSAVAVVMAVASVVYLGTTIVGKIGSIAARDVWLLGLVVATLAWIVAWSELVAWRPAWGGEIDLFTLAASALVVFVCGPLADQFTRQRPDIRQ